LGFGAQREVREAGWRDLSASSAGTTGPIETGLLAIQDVSRVSGITLEVAALPLNCKLFVAVLFFGLLGTGLAFGFCDLAKTVHARTGTFILRAKTLAKRAEKAGAARCKKGVA
jgi:hypothetical protein